jgi:hypothetical protein
LHASIRGPDGLSWGSEKEMGKFSMLGGFLGGGAFLSQTSNLEFLLLLGFL